MKKPSRLKKTLMKYKKIFVKKNTRILFIGC